MRFSVAEYERTAYGYPRNDKSATAAYAALVSYQKGEEGLSGAEKDAWHRRATDAGVKFAQTFPEHPDSAGVLTRAAEDIFAAKDLPRAITVSESILARQPPVDPAKQRIAWTIIARSHYDRNEYGETQEIGGDGDAEPHRIGVQRDRHLRQRGGDHRGIDLLHDDRRTDDHGDDFWLAPGGH